MAGQESGTRQALELKGQRLGNKKLAADWGMSSKTLLAAEPGWAFQSSGWVCSRMKVHL